MKSLLIVVLAALASVGTAAPEEARKTHTVLITGFKFVPETLEVSVGDTVIWKNQDIVPHTATGKKFESSRLSKDQAWSYVAKAKGSFPYICRFHPTMKALLTVR
ncbi:MAG: cupredoxin family copper-binding protein [Bryobacteraceae bacterium]|nr:cupredoxin family copper-binding protein [Bryobacteraceae bacterium]